MVKIDPWVVHKPFTKGWILEAHFHPNARNGRKTRLGRSIIDYIRPALTDQSVRDE